MSVETDVTFLARARKVPNEKKKKKQQFIVFDAVK